MKGRHRKAYEGVMADVKGIEPEQLFSRMPELGGLKPKFLGEHGGWRGLLVHYAVALLPMDLSERDRFLDVGCGMGEHVILAGLGMPGLFPPVEHALGVSSSAEEISRATNLTRYAAENRGEFRELVRLPSFGRPDLYASLPGLDARKLGMVPSNVAFLKTNVFHLPIPDSQFSKTLSSSVAPYIKSHEKRRTMMKELLRVTCAGGLINIYSFQYPAVNGGSTTAPDELRDVAGVLGVVVRERADLLKRIPSGRPLEGLEFTKMVFEVVEKPKKMPAGIIRE